MICKVLKAFQHKRVERKTILSNQDIRGICNPHYPAEPSWFVGRDLEIGKFKEMVEALRTDGAENNPIVVYGPEGIGKSSFLKKVKNETSKSDCRVEIIEATPNTVPTFVFCKMLEALNENYPENKSQQQENLRTSLGRTSLSSPRETPLDELTRRLPEIDDKLSKENKILVLFIDQCERVIEDHDVCTYINSIVLTVRTRSRIMFGICIAGNKLEKLQENCPELCRFANRFDIGRLSISDAEKLLSLRVHQLGMRLDPRVIDPVVRLSCEIPACIVSILQNLRKKANESDTGAIDIDVLKAIKSILDDKFKSLVPIDPDHLKALETLAVVPGLQDTISSLAKSMQWTEDKAKEVYEKIRVDSVYTESPIVEVSGQNVSLCNPYFAEYLIGISKDNELKKKNLESYGALIGKLVTTEKEIPTDFLQIVFQHVALQCQNNNEKLTDCLEKIAEQLRESVPSGNPSFQTDAETLYFTIVEMFVKRGDMVNARLWAKEAIKFFYKREDFDVALRFERKLVNDILVPSGEDNDVKAECEKGLELAAAGEKTNIDSKSNFNVQGEIFLQIAETELKQKNEDAALDHFTKAVFMYRKSAKFYEDIGDTWTAFSHSNTEKLILSHYLKNRLPSLVPLSADASIRKLRKLIAVVGVRDAGVYTIIPSIVWSSLLQTKFQRALIVDLGLSHELVDHLSNKPYSDLKPELSLVGLLQRWTNNWQQFFDEKICGISRNLNYSQLLRNGDFKIEPRNESPDLRPEYLTRVRALSEKGKELYLLPLDTDHLADYIRDTDVLKLKKQEILRLIIELTKTIDPDILFITRPGLPKEGRFDDLNCFTLFNEILDLADDIIVCCRGDSQEKWDMYSKLAYAVIQKPSWKLKTHIIINRWLDGTTTGDLEDRICFRLPNIKKWGEIVDRKSIPFLDLGLDKPTKEDLDLSNSLKRMWQLIEQQSGRIC